MRRVIKRLFLAIAAAAVLGVGLIAYTFVPEKIDVARYQSELNSFTATRPTDPASLPSVSLSLIKCGKMISRESFIFLGGRWSETYESGMAAILVQHPNGNILLDTGFGTNVDEHFRHIPSLMRTLTTYDKGTPAVRQLEQNGIPAERINRVILSHSHWDHVSGLEDFPGVEVWLPTEEEQFARSLSSNELIARILNSLNLHAFEFSDGAYESFEESFDLFGDGSVVLVPLPGHTPGSTGVFVNLRSGKRFLYIGDLTWAIDGIRLPAERPWISRKLADTDDEGVRKSIVRVHELTQRYPSLVVVPAHDRRVHDSIANFPETER